MTVFGDCFQAGGAATTNEWSMWPDVMRYKIWQMLTMAGTAATGIGASHHLRRTMGISP